MTVGYMSKLAWEDLVDMLKEAGVDNMVHQHKIHDALFSTNSSDDLASDENSSVTSAAASGEYCLLIGQ